MHGGLVNQGINRTHFLRPNCQVLTLAQEEAIGSET